MWKVITEEKNNRKTLKFLYDINAHKKSVNIVRFSPNGKFLATASDDGLIFIFKPDNNLSWQEVNTEKQLDRSTVRGHASDIYALSWSPDSKFLVTGSIDSNTILWKMNEKEEAVFEESYRNHCHFVQGLKAHPSGYSFISQGSDKSCKVYNTKLYKLNEVLSHELGEVKVLKPIKPKKTFMFTNDISKRIYSIKSEHSEELSKKTAIFVDDSLPSFFRRLDYSPDGSIVIAPSGLYKPDTKKQKSPCCYVFRSTNLQQPINCLTGFVKPAVCVSFCSIAFTLRDKKQDVKSFLNTPYRYIFCVLTLSEIVVYDSQTGRPIALVQDAHYAQLTDATWVDEGDKITLLVSSSDGYISLLEFSTTNIGKRYKGEEGNEFKDFDIGKIVEDNFPKEELLKVVAKPKRRKRLKKGTELSKSTEIQKKEEKNVKISENSKKRRIELNQVKEVLLPKDKIRRVALNKVS